MRTVSLFVLLFGAVVIAVPITSRDSIQPVYPTASPKRGWSIISKAPSSALVRIVIGVRHTNLDLLDKTWWDIANPSSERYGKYLTSEELQLLIAPEPQALPAIIDWLTESNAERIEVSQHRDFVVAHIAVADLEKALGVSLHLFRHTSFEAHEQAVIRSAQPVVAPPHLTRYIDIISGVSDFSRSVDHHGRHRRRHHHHSDSNTKVTEDRQDEIAPSISFIDNGNHEMLIQFTPFCRESGDYGQICNSTAFRNEISGFTVKLTAKSDTKFEQTQFLSIDHVECDEEEDQGTTWVYGCSGYVVNVTNWLNLNVSISTNFTNGDKSKFSTALPSVITGPWALPHVIKRLYNITQCETGPIRSGDVTSTGGVILFEHQYYSPSDLVKFLDGNYLPDAEAAVVNPLEPNDPSQPGDEGQADIELLSANGVGSSASTYWYSGDAADGVLLWALQIANVSDADVPKVWSLSWGVGENEFDEYVGVGAQTRINTELAKMGIRGITVVIASGDAGVRPIGREVDDCGVFLPDFPASSPYVLTVSATLLAQPNNAKVANVGSRANFPICDLPLPGSPEPNISCDEDGLETATEIAVSCCDGGTVWTTGGGFSNNYTQATWQSQAVASFLSRSKSKLPPAEFWNNTGRAYPDISMIGDKVPTIVNGQLSNFGGTSASAPIAAAIITLLNSVRVARGKPLLGPVTPLFYSIAAKYPDQGAFRDITVGHSNCGELACCTYGFECTEGWDAVSGLGSLNFQVLKELILKDI